MPTFVLADPATGVIRSSAATTMPMEVVIEHWERGGCDLVETASRLPLEAFDQHLVVDGACVARDTMAPSVSAASIAADGVDEATIAGLPDPCQVTLAGAVSAGPVAVSGGAITLTSTTAGTITLTVRADPAYAPWSTTIHAL